MATRKQVRPLGSREIAASSRHALGLYRRLAHTCCYTKSPQGDSFAAIENAVARVVKDTPFLRVGIVDENTNKPYFVDLNPINLKSHVEWKKAKNEDELFHILEEEHDQLFLEIDRQPPWKVTVVEGLTDTTLEIIFAVHHSIADGKSTAVFHKHLLQALNIPNLAVPELRNHVLDLTIPADLPLPLEELIKFNISFLFLLKTLWKEFAPAWLKPTPFLPWGGKPVTLEPYKTNVRLVTISNGTLTPLLAACRAKGVTLTPLLHILILASLAQRLPADTASSFSGTTPISLRPLAQPQCAIDLNEAFSVLVTSSMHEFDQETVSNFRTQQSTADKSSSSSSLWEDLIWKETYKLRSQLKTKVETLPNDDIVGLLSWVSDWHKYWTSKFGAPRDCTWEVSNIGSMSGSSNSTSSNMSSSSLSLSSSIKTTQSPWKITRSIMSQPVSIAGTAICVSVSGVKDGPVSVALTWQEGIVETGLVEGLADDLDAWFQTFEQSGYFALSR
jgi:hypothetical protein